MPMPELPVNVDDPSRDTQREGERMKEPFYQSQRGKKKQVPTMNEPEGPIRYKE